MTTKPLKTDQKVLEREIESATARPDAAGS